MYRHVHTLGRSKLWSESDYMYTPWTDSENMEKLLQDFEITNGTRLKCDDFLQEYSIVVTIAHA